MRIEAHPPKIRHLASFFPNEINGRKWAAAISALPLVLAGLGAIHRSGSPPAQLLKTEQVIEQVQVLPKGNYLQIQHLMVDDRVTGNSNGNSKTMPPEAEQYAALPNGNTDNPRTDTDNPRPQARKMSVLQNRRMPLCDQHHLRTVWRDQYRWRCRR